MKRAIIFIDANNWYHNIKGWFKPSDIDIKKVANLICNNFKIGLKEIRWYTSVPNIEDNKLNYIRHMDFLSNLEKNGIKIITRKLQRLSNKEIIKKRKELLNSWNLCETCKLIVESDFLDIKDPNQKEKGIDVRIAIDMVKEALQDNLDYCILISGDADFAPAFELIKNIGKKVLSAFIPKGYANELRQKFSYLVIKREDLNKCLKEYKKKEQKFNKNENIK